jgi:hypothetical protein
MRNSFGHGRGKGSAFASRIWRIECLEPRLAMAGNITASVSAQGDLTIAGDAGDNQIIIEGNGNAGELRLTPGGDDFGGQNTLNGGLAPITFIGVTGSVLANMGAANDVIFFNAASIAGAVVLDGGTGADQFFLGTFTTIPPAELSIGRELIIRGSVGYNRVWHGFVRVGTSEIVEFGSEEGLVLSTDEFNGPPKWIVAQDLVVRTGDGNDTIDFNRLSVGGYTLIETGFNNDLVKWERCQFGISTAILTGELNDTITIDQITFNGGLYIDAGLGHDFCGLIRSSVTHSFVLITQAGFDTVSMSNLELATLNVDTGIDDDYVAMEATTMDRITVLLGDGNDTLSMRVNSVSMEATLDGGAGDDLWEELANGIVSLTFRNFERYRFS